MANIRYVIAHGRRIAVETLEDPVTAPKPHKRKRDAFVILPLSWAAAVVAEVPEILVYADLRHRAWRAKGQSFVLPNGWLKAEGVSRKVKHRVLRGFEAAGAIVVERSPRKSPRITVVDL